MTARRIPLDKHTDLLALFGPAPTDAQREEARELMAPYLAEFQAAADAQTRQDFDAREQICQTCGTPERLHSSAEFGGMSGPCLAFKPPQTLQPQLATPLPPMALRATQDIEKDLVEHGCFRSDVVATIIAKHVAPLAELTRQLTERMAPLVAMLEESRRKHNHCDDSWYCCPRCDCPDHAAGPGNEPCTCGADEWNARVDAVLGTQKEDV